MLKIRILSQVIVRSILQRFSEHGWMGPEWHATDKERIQWFYYTMIAERLEIPYEVTQYSSERYLHKFIRRCPILLKHAIKYIESDELYLRQMSHDSCVYAA